MHAVLTGPLFVSMVAEGAEHLKVNKATINSLNVFPVPDGDTGTNMTLTLHVAVEQFADEDVDALSLSEAAKRTSRGVLLGARGNSGVILSQFLRGFADGVAHLTTGGPEELAYALQCATSLAYRAVIKPVEGTMLTVGKGASEAAQEAAQAGADLAGVLRAAVRGAEQSLAKTPELLPILKKAGVVDAGGQGLVCFLRGALAACEGRTSAGTEIETPVVPAEQSFDFEEIHEAMHANLSPDEIEYGYCTEFLIKGEELPSETIRASLEPLGDSLLVVGDADLLKVHLHTEHPGQALEIGVQHGNLLDISIDNMREQHRQVVAQGTMQGTVPSGGGMSSGAASADSEDGADVVAFPSEGGVATALTESATVGVVAVVSGSGWEELMLSLGVDAIVSGGQTMNPSAAELLDAIDSVSASSVIVLPNNSNIIFAARQAQQLSDKDVHVVETTAAPAGVAAMMAYNPLGEPADVSATMGAAAGRIRTGEVAYAVRDTEAWGDGIKAGDKLGIADGEIVAVVDGAEEAALRTLSHMMSDDMSFISIYYGEDVDEAAARRLKAEVRQTWPDCEVELFQGGQPVYFYLLSVE